MNLLTVVTSPYIYQCIMVQDFMTNIYIKIRKYMLMMTGVEFPQKQEVEISTIKNNNLLIQINIML